MLTREFSKESWYVRVYFWCLTVCWRFLKPEYAEGEIRYIKEKGTNICSFSRVMLGALLILVLHLLVYGALIIALTMVPIRLFGGDFYLSIAWRVGLASLLVLVGVAAMWFLRRKHKEQPAQEPAERRHGEETRRRVRRPVRTSPTFREVLGMRFRSWKEKTCFPIVFVDPQKED